MLPTLRFLVFALSVSISSASATEDFNVTNEPVFLAGLKRNGEIVYMREELAHKLEEERETWHWTPWMRTRIDLSDNVLREADCVEANSIESFPEGPFTDDQLLRGAFLLYALFGIYAFTLLALVCNDFFIPCVELICEDLKIPQNVAAATFMAVATSFPEFFVNVIATFVTESDMGIGTIVGSAIFNALGVGAVGSLAAIRPIKIEMSPVTRDVLIYMINASVLVAVVWDGQVDWYEALVLAILYVLYFILMFNSVRLFGFIERRFLRCCKSRANERKTIQNAESDKPVEEGVDNKAFDGTETNGPTGKTLDDDEAAVKPNKSIFRFPKGKSWLYIIWWMYTWPIKLILGFTVPSPVTYRKFYPFAFFMCIVWIGTTSYCVTWSMTVIGHTFFIPDSVMGMTFLAFGGCLPEACSIFIMSRKGEGGIGVSNALGANSLAILFALGLPWLIKTLTLLGQGEEAVVYINSNGIDFVIGSLLVAVSCLWIVLFIGKFTLRKSVGAVLAVLYITFITFAILVELGIILDRMDAFC
ncbi:sodium/potassium/calcium exchanger 5-like isoform X2 [Choristoneura fumiferana]|uniref:sodium/potassium/calcium exchanger 5-like isoform X2 n=1 Tax=Choristoneura fumiferana TaxID=7141 RepID=UPI003D15D7F1